MSADPLDERLDLRDELLDADHEMAAFLHPLLWGDTTHYEEPDDGTNCEDCYDQSDQLRRVIEAAVRAAS